jgi:hypothetical protein
MEKRIAKAHVECNNKGWYSVYTKESFPFGFFGEGRNADEAMRDFLNVFEAMSEAHQHDTGEKIVVEFEFVYDASAFLQHYKGLLTLSGLSRMTGINKGQLSQYVCGRRHPSPRTNERMRQSVRRFAEELANAMG